MPEYNFEEFSRENYTPETHSENKETA
jgi:hypothetical protein